MTDEDDDELLYEVSQLTEPFVLRLNRIWISVEVPGGSTPDPLVDLLLAEIVSECRTALDDYGKPDALIELKHFAADAAKLPGEMMVHEVAVTTDETTVEFIHDRMLSEFGPNLRARLDEVGRTGDFVMSWNDGMLDKY